MEFNSMRFAFFLIFAVQTVMWAYCRAEAQRRTSPPEDPLYVSVADDTYEQEIGSKIATDSPVTAVGAYDGRTYAVVDGTLHVLNGDTLQVVDGAPRGWLRLFSLRGRLWGTTADGVYRFENGDDSPSQMFDETMVDMCVHNGSVHGATKEAVYRLENGKFVNIEPEDGWLSSDRTVLMPDHTQVLVDPVRIGPIRRIVSYSGTLYLLGRRGLSLLDGPVFETSPVDWGMFPSKTLRDMVAMGSRLLITTDRGVAVLRGAALTAWTGEDGLPYEDTTCLARGFGRDVWIGTSKGAIRKVGTDYHYFGAEHWLPADYVHDIAIDGKRVAIATDKGIGIISYEPYTLRKKAAFFERSVEEWGHKRLGFVHRLYRTGDGTWAREVSDNDGGHTAHYLAAMCFKYAVTGDEAARREALDAFEAMMWLRTITGTDGFVARAIRARGVDEGKPARTGSGGLPAKWYPTDDGLWLWKGDTSSDEINAHFYSVSLFHDLVARSHEKQRAVEHLTRVARHIIDNGWVLRDKDGQPTRWGRWDPEYLLRPYGFEARGLNGMEAQTYMWTALALSGDPIYRAGLDQLLEWRYHTYTVREKVTFPPESVVPWDDELAFRCFHPLLTYCDDPYLRSIYLRALARHWEVMRMQQLPFFNFIYGGLTGNDCESPEAVQHLREWSLDTVSHTYRNSHRVDLATQRGYTPYAGGTRAISPRELASTWGSRSAIRYDGGSGGRSVTPPVGWLEDYWMGRYYGMIQPPSVNDPTLVSVPASSGHSRGAAPYDGPPRPDLLPGN